MPLNSSKIGIILVVEDDPTLQLLMKTLLKRMGYVVEVVGSGEAAAERAGADTARICMDLACLACKEIAPVV